MKRYEFLEIRNLNGIEIAYLLDTKTGKVIKSLVDDFTNGLVVEDESIFDRTKKKRILPKFEDKEEIDEELKLKVFDPSDKPKPAMIPTHLAGVFVPQDSPGAAIETRRV